VLGSITANGMFRLAAVTLDVIGRPERIFLEAMLHRRLLLVLFLPCRNNAPEPPLLRPSAPYIGRRLLLPSSASFANPAISVGRMFLHTFAGLCAWPPPCRVRRGSACPSAPCSDARHAELLYPDVTPGETGSHRAPPPAGDRG